MQNASIPPNSIPQVAMSHLSGGSQGGVILPNGQMALVGFPDPICGHAPTACLIASTARVDHCLSAHLCSPAHSDSRGEHLGLQILDAHKCRLCSCRCRAWRIWVSLL